jgi:hyperosmotically inducible protein
MKRTRILILVLALGLVVPVALMATEYNPDQVTAELQAKIDQAKVSNHGAVQVTFNNGVATLTGTVDNLGSKLDAVKAARKVKGVTQVVDNIRIVAPNVTPQQIVAQAGHDVLMYPFYTIFDNVQLQANGNTLIVSGQVTQPYKKHDLGAILADIRGVAHLENKLQVLPLSSFDNQLRFRLARAIYGRAGFELYAVQANPPIHIIVDNGHVTLDGAVRDQMDKTIAGMTANSVPFVFSVKNNLRVAG